MTGTEPQQVLIGHLWTWKTRYLEGQTNFNEINRKYFKIQSSGMTITVHQFHEDVIINEKKLVKKVEPVVERKARHGKKSNSNDRIRNALCQLRFFRHKDNLKTTRETCIRWNANFRGYNFPKKTNILSIDKNKPNSIKVEKEDSTIFVQESDSIKINEQTNILFDNIVHNSAEHTAVSPSSCIDFNQIKIKTPKSYDNMQFDSFSDNMSQSYVLDSNNLSDLKNENPDPEMCTVLQENNKTGECVIGLVQNDKISSFKQNVVNVEEVPVIYKNVPTEELVDTGFNSDIINYEDPISLDSITSLENKDETYLAQCDLCYKQFACNVSLMAHRKIDHYMCSFCGDAFLYDGELDDHQMDCGLFDLDSKSDSVACMVQLVMQDLT